MTTLDWVIFLLRTERTIHSIFLWTELTHLKAIYERNSALITGLSRSTGWGLAKHSCNNYTEESRRIYTADIEHYEHWLWVDTTLGYNVCQLRHHYKWKRTESYEGTAISNQMSQMSHNLHTTHMKADQRSLLPTYQCQQEDQNEIWKRSELHSRLESLASPFGQSQGRPTAT